MGGVRIAGANSIGQKGKMNLRALIGQLGQSAAAAEDFVVGVGGDDVDSLMH